MAKHRGKDTGKDIPGNIRSGPPAATLLTALTLRYGKTCDTNTATKNRSSPTRL